jgi:hypothetical protein
MYGHVLADNQPMLRLARSLRFSAIDSDQGEGVVKIVCDLPGRSSHGSRCRPTGFFWQQLFIAMR